MLALKSVIRIGREGITENDSSLPNKSGKWTWSIWENVARGFGKRSD